LFVHVDHALALPRNRVKRRGATMTVYALCDHKGWVRYVGITRASLPARLVRHLEHPTNDAMAVWLNSTRSSGLRPVMHALEYVRKNEWEDAERGWIYWFRQRGRLLNVDRGGQARDGRGRPRSFEAGAFEAPVGEPIVRGPLQQWRSPSVKDHHHGRSGPTVLKASVAKRWAAPAVEIRGPRAKAPVKEASKPESQAPGSRADLLQTRLQTPTDHLQ
jgi:hypothetical protein